MVLVLRQGRARIQRLKQQKRSDKLSNPIEYGQLRIEVQFSVVDWKQEHVISKACTMWNFYKTPKHGRGYCLTCRLTTDSESIYAKQNIRWVFDGARPICSGRPGRRAFESVDRLLTACVRVDGRNVLRLSRIWIKWSQIDVVAIKHYFRRHSLAYQLACFYILLAGSLSPPRKHISREAIMKFFAVAICVASCVSRGIYFVSAKPVTPNLSEVVSASSELSELSAVLYATTRTNLSRS